MPLRGVLHWNIYTDYDRRFTEAHDLADAAREIMKKADRAECDIVLPTDVVVAAEFKEGAPSRTVPRGCALPDAPVR